VIKRPCILHFLVQESTSTNKFMVYSQGLLSAVLSSVHEYI
jgi:hypothetical protein